MSHLVYSPPLHSTPIVFYPIPLSTVIHPESSHAQTFGIPTTPESLQWRCREQFRHEREQFLSGEGTGDLFSRSNQWVRTATAANTSAGTTTTITSAPSGDDTTSTVTSIPATTKSLLESHCLLFCAYDSLPYICTTLYTRCGSQSTSLILILILTHV